MRSCFDEHAGHVLDPHTAVAWHVSRNTPKEDGVARIILSTASPYKFCRDVCAALGVTSEGSDFDCMRTLEAASKTHAPAALSALEAASVRFEDVMIATICPPTLKRRCGELL